MMQQRSKTNDREAGLVSYVSDTHTRSEGSKKVGHDDDLECVCVIAEQAEEYGGQNHGDARISGPHNCALPFSARHDSSAWQEPRHLDWSA